MTQKRMRAAAAILTIGLTFGALLPSPGSAQQSSVQNQALDTAAQPQAQVSQTGAAPTRQLSLSPDYSSGNPWFPGVRAPYEQVSISEPTLANSPRVDQLI